MASSDDPIAYFLEDMSYHGRSDRTIEAYERVLREFQSYLEAGNTRDDDRSVDLTEATHRDCLAWVHDRRKSVASSTIASYASYLHRFYSYMVEVGEFDRNPMTLVMEEMDERIDTDPSRRDVSVADMRSFVADIGHPGERAIVLTLLKTGIRAGELCNLDLRDVNLTGIAIPTGPVRPELRGHPNSIFVSSSPSAGASVNDERRTESNKRERDTVIPVDDELKAVLEQYLAIRPDSRSSADPLFVSTDRNWGQRLSGSAVHYVVGEHATEHGWYDSDGGAGTNVTPHYFRHFFTTHLRDRTGDRGIVKYLRGDVASDVIDTYTHNWGNRVREVYEENIYRLLR
ncbi:tyrosine-type recombinase/integrase [Halanaeroarchaeum sulfurireducens]|uniref:Integrase family protein n=1 Tax=Halanaeroarchaeum sulfurireducens TaxID=1604004 RepID=A0A0F7PCA4_9EURY|nr:tyrosine-type recombinase/integrase [Halanaeroarchaeum sulfurireducens]AKH97820.1 integrase family protein [Halanaeroarchaeum sulfurireducens]ALG82214.1 integrase family protein [Halanaeroarchaeum sulfurireducens]